MNEFYTAITNVGFPIAITGYLLFFIEKRIAELTKAITNLTIEVVRLSEKIDKR